LQALGSKELRLLCLTCYKQKLAEETSNKTTMWKK